MAETVTCVVPYNGQDVEVAVRVAEDKIQVQHPAAGWIDIGVLNERLRGRKITWVKAPCGPNQPATCTFPASFVIAEHDSCIVGFCGHCPLGES